MKRIYLILVFYLLSAAYCFGQTSMIDSLLTLLKTTKQDTTKVNVFNKLFFQFEFEDDKKAKKNLDKAFELSDKIGYKKGLADTYLNLGFFAQDKSNYAEALKNYLFCLDIRKKLNDEKGIADAYNSIGSVNYSQGNYEEGLENYFKALKIKKSINDKKGEANLYNNTGLIYEAQGNYPEALKNHIAALKIREAISDKLGIATSYNNMGTIYDAQGNYQEALKNYSASLKIKEQIGDKSSIAASYSNIGIVYREKNDFSSALKNLSVALDIFVALDEKANIASSYNNVGNVYYFESLREKSVSKVKGDLEDALTNYSACLKIEEAIGDKAGIIYSYGNIGNIYSKQKKYKDAEIYTLKANELSKEIGYKEFLRDSYNVLSYIDSATGNFKGAYENHKLYILYKDSLDNEETRKKTIQSQMTYDFEKKEAVATAEHKKELENQKVLADEKNRKQRVVLFFVLGSLLLVLFFAGFIFRSLRITRKQKNIIEEQKNLVEQQKREVEEQKNLVEEHQKEIIDSITYARRIQRSLLPTDKYIERNLNRLRRL